MGVVFLSKEKAKEKKSLKGSSEVAVVVERMAELSIEINKLKKLVDEYDKMKSSLVKRIPEDAEESEPVVFEGINHVVEFSPRPMVRFVTDLSEVRDLLGDDVFMSLAKVNLGDLDKYLGPVELGSVVSESRSGSRRCAVKEV